MAYDGYRSPPPDQQHQQHQQHQHQQHQQHQPFSNSYDLPDPRHYQNQRISSPSFGSEYDARRSSQVPPQGHPAFDAVNNAFDTAPAASQVSPDIIAQITEQVRSQVINSLKAEGVTAGSTPVPMQAPPPPPPQQPQKQRSPPPQTFGHPSPVSPITSFPPHKVATPPSPARRERDFSSDDDDGHDKSSYESQHSYASKEESRPVKEDLSSRYGERLSTSDERGPATGRPAAAQRLLTSDEETTLEKIWQPLFDSQGQPTARLGQFLRGLALHLVEDYEPKNSLVISPAKMQSFYQEVKLADETYPWSTIFGGKLHHTTIGKIYRDLRCEHHLVQDSLSQEPYIPALTSKGFETWVTIMIQAHPESEYERLAKAVLDMPISNADDRKERFPKQLSRRLFPKSGDLQVRQRCVAAVCADPQVQRPNHTSFPPPPPKNQQASAPAPSAGAFERERKPYSNQADISSGTAITDDDDFGAELKHTGSIPIERERKPYVGREGQGKFHEEGSSLPNGSSQTLRPEDGRGHTRKQRSNSSVSQGANSTASARSNDSPTRQASTKHHRRKDSTTHDHRERERDRDRDRDVPRRRAHSPSLTANPYTRSDGAVGDVPLSYYTASNIHAEPEEDYSRYRRDRDRDREGDERRARDDYARRMAEEDSRYDRQRTEDYYRRSQTAPGGTDGYGSTAYPPPPTSRY